MGSVRWSLGHTYAKTSGDTQACQRMGARGDNRSARPRAPVLGLGPPPEGSARRGGRRSLGARGGVRTRRRARLAPGARCGRLARRALRPRPPAPRGLVVEVVHFCVPGWLSPPRRSPISAAACLASTTHHRCVAPRSLAMKRPRRASAGHCRQRGFTFEITHLETPAPGSPGGARPRRTRHASRAGRRVDRPTQCIVRPARTSRVRVLLSTGRVPRSCDCKPIRPGDVHALL
jgi:hypothetical protein